MTTLDRVLELLILLLPIIGLVIKWRAANTAEEKVKVQEKMIDAVVTGVHEFKRTRMITKEEREALDDKIKEQTNAAGVEKDLKPVVKKITSHLIGIPKLD